MVFLSPKPRPQFNHRENIKQILKNPLKKTPDVHSSGVSRSSTGRKVRGPQHCGGALGHVTAKCPGTFCMRSWDRMRPLRKYGGNPNTEQSIDSHNASGPRSQGPKLVTVNWAGDMQGPSSLFLQFFYKSKMATKCRTLRKNTLKR